MAGQGEVYGHSSDAPTVCLTPSGPPTWSCGAVFIVFSAQEQWPLKVSHCSPAASQQMAGVGLLEATCLGPFRRRETAGASCWSCINGGRPRGWWGPRGWWEDSFSAHFLLGSLSPSSMVLGSGSRSPGWESISGILICSESSLQILLVPVKMCFLPSVGETDIFSSIKKHCFQVAGRGQGW